MFGEFLLGVWTAAGWIWWLVSLKLVLGKERVRCGPPREPSEKRFLSVFKPLPRLPAEGLGEMAVALASFVAQLDDHSELLLGVHAEDCERVTSFLEEMALLHPEASLKVVFRSEPDQHANPKIAWQAVLAKEAQGDLWLWSDADIRAPDGLVEEMRAEFSAANGGLLTFPYVIQEARSASSYLDLFFVNADFYPGVLLMKKLVRADFGLGAGMLFLRDEFLSRVNWDELGAELADDFYLGQKLGPVRISSQTLSTTAVGRTWKSAILHYFRWNKTIRWSRPWGKAVMIFVMPLMGWTVALVLTRHSAWVWLGWVVIWQVDVLAASALSRCAGCRLGWKGLGMAELWAFGRLVGWAALWLPIPVWWGSQKWSGPRKVCP